MLVFSLFILGLVLGSFYNVVIWRIPRKKSIISPRSHCPQCKNNLSYSELIPVISFLLQKGKCRHCEAKIGVQYPIVELLTGLLFGFSAYITESLPSLLVSIIFVSLLLIAGVIDYRHQILPNKITIPGIVIGLILAALGWTVPLLSSITGAVVGGTTLLIIALISKGGMGLGDVKFLALIGAFLGPPFTFVAIFLASLAGAVIGTIYLIITRQGRKTPIPFGPFLALGGLIAYFFPFVYPLLIN